jgi:hypothetical protein
MRCHWHRMYRACGVIDTACMVHAVSLIPHAQKILSNNFEKKKVRCKTAMVCKKIKNAGGVTDTACKIWHRMHDRRTIRTAMTAFIENIYQKHICSQIVLPSTKKYINLKASPKRASLPPSLRRRYSYEYMLSLDSMKKKGILRNNSTKKLMR